MVQVGQLIASPHGRTDSMMSFDEEILSTELRQATVTLRKRLAAFPEAQAKAPRPDGGWSALENVEHVILVDELFRERIRTAYPLGAPVHNAEREAELRARMVERQNKRQALDSVRPQGRYQTREQGLAALEQNLTMNLAFLADHVAAARCNAWTHPISGMRTCFETFLIMAAHACRHAEQMEETANSLFSEET